jgi:aquaporin Z
MSATQKKHARTYQALERVEHEFLDSSREWRRVFSEWWGTFLLVVVAAGAHVVAAQSNGKVTLDMIVVAPGLIVMAIIYFMGTVSGAHLNPAVTLAFALRRNFPWWRVPGYVVAQLAGGIAAALFLRIMFGKVGNLGATIPGEGVSYLQALLMEVLLTAGLINTILGTASGARNIGTNGALAVGGYIALAGLWAEPISGASMNPARSLAPDLLRGDLATTWIYIVGPLVGALIGVVFEWILKGPATVMGTVTAQGTLDDEDSGQALKAKRAELEREIESLESRRVALYMPGITIVPQEGLPEEDADQQLARLKAAIIEIDTQLGTLATGRKS